MMCVKLEDDLVVTSSLIHFDYFIKLGNVRVFENLGKDRTTTFWQLNMY